MAHPAALVPDDEGAGRFLPWVIAVMVFLGTLVSTVGLLLNQTVGDWRAELSGTITVEIPVPEPAEAEARVAAALDLLHATAGVQDAAVLPPDAVAALLEPWLGDAAGIADLPVPRLIDVKLDQAGRPDMRLLSKRLTDAVPGARIDDHALWLERLARLAQGAQLVAAGTVALIGLATAAVVVFATRAAFTAHHRVIEVLHLIGARDSFIAGHFQRRALVLGLQGGILGLLLGAIILLMLAYLARDLDAALLPRLAMTPSHLAVLAALPVAAALIAMLTARLTVLRALARLP